MGAEKRWGFIINPVAGNGFAGRYAKTVEDVIHKRGLDAEIVFTGHGRLLIRRPTI